MKALTKQRKLKEAGRKALFKAAEKMKWTLDGKEVEYPCGWALDTGMRIGGHNFNSSIHISWDTVRECVRRGASDMMDVDGEAVIREFDAENFARLVEPHLTPEV